MKRKILLIMTIIICSLISGCKNIEDDSERFKKEYSQVGEYNVFVYRTSEEIIKILEHGTGVVYLGFPECPWCQAYVPYLNEVADIEGLEKIYYYNIYNDRKENTEFYKKIVSIISDQLQYDEEGNKRIYVPAVITVKKGEIIGFNDETSYDTLGYEEPAEYWTEDRVKSLKSNLTKMIVQVVDNRCTDCNE